MALSIAILMLVGLLADWVVRQFSLPGLIGMGLVHAGATGTCSFAVLLARLPFNRGQDSGTGVR